MAIATVNPATGVTETTYEAYTDAQVEDKVAAAAAAHETLKHTTFAQRATWLGAAADLLDRDAEATARLLTTEMGKILAQAEAEVHKCAAGMRFYAEHAEALLADQELDDPSSVTASRAGARWQPMGVVLAVMPWNFPLWQVVRFAAPALMAGNTGLLKHASNVPQSALYLEQVFAEAGFPEGAFGTLLIGSKQVEAVIKDARVKAVTVTGSEPAGRAVAGTAGGEVKKAVLELGGSDPFVVMPSADLDAAVETAVKARLNNNGQSCICAKRFIVHTDVYDAFAERFTQQMSEAVVGDPMDPGTQVGPLATESGRDDVVELVEDAVAHGATVLTGGTVPDGAGWFYPPTVLADLSDDMRIVQEEVFGPVAALYRAGDRDDALRIANQTSFGLSSSVWTTDAEEEEWFVENLQAGAVFVNGMSVSYPELPFGGVKSSGFGRELAGEGIREFCNLKTVWRA